MLKYILLIILGIIINILLNNVNRFSIGVPAGELGQPCIPPPFSSKFITPTRLMLLQNKDTIGISGFTEVNTIDNNGKTFKLYSTTEYTNILSVFDARSKITGNSKMNRSQNYKSNYYLFEVIESTGEEFLRGRVGLRQNVLEYITVFPLGKYYGTIFFLILHKSNIIINDIEDPPPSEYDFYRTILYNSVTKKSENSNGMLENDTTDKFSIFHPSTDESHGEWLDIYHKHAIAERRLLEEYLIPYVRIEQLFQEITNTEEQMVNSFSLFLMKGTYSYWINIPNVPVKVFDKTRFMEDFNNLENDEITIELMRDYIVN